MFIVKIFIFFTLSYDIRTEGEHCGRPGRPANGTAVPTVTLSYSAGDRVTYKCLEGFVLFGSEETTCQWNGTWSDEVPLCDFNLARAKPVIQSETLWSYSADLAVDGNAETCSFAAIESTGLRWWQVHLGHKFNIINIGVAMSPGSVQEFTIYVIELLPNNTALYKPCTAFKGVFQSHKAVFQCNDGVGHPGQFIHVRDDRKEAEYFGLCEVEVFAYRERIPCGEPELPINTNLERLGDLKAQYFCRSGFYLEGDQSVVCSSRGKWEGIKPKCREVQCSPPEHIPHGAIELTAFKTAYTYGTIASYSCNPGYVLVGNHTRICEQTGFWSGETPVCEAVDCGSPPLFPNARFMLPNGNTFWNAVALYTCNEGFLLHKATGDTMTTCLDIGAWRFINVTCIAVEIQAIAMHGSSEDKLPNSTSNIPRDQELLEGPKMIIISLAVVASLLAIVVLLVGVKVARDRLQRTPGPLPRNDKLGGSKSSLFPCVSLPRKGIFGWFAMPSNSTDMNANYQTPSLCHTWNHSVRAKSTSQDAASHFLDMSDPPYERVGHRSEHNYETLSSRRICSPIPADTLQMDPGYETLQQQNLCSCSEGDLKPEYETVRESDHKIDDPSYETIRGPLCCRNHLELNEKTPITFFSTDLSEIGDLLPVQPTIFEESEPLSESSNYFQNATTRRPGDIMALYAVVDKSKKMNNKMESAISEAAADDVMNKVHCFQNISVDVENVTKVHINIARPLPPLPDE